MKFKRIWINRLEKAQKPMKFKRIWINRLEKAQKRIQINI
jgi:hypothetical protein